MTPSAAWNIQVEITINDQVGSEPPVKKTLNVIAADRAAAACPFRR